MIQKLRKVFSKFKLYLLILVFANVVDLVADNYCYLYSNSYLFFIVSNFTELYAQLLDTNSFLYAQNLYIDSSSFDENNYIQDINIIDSSIYELHQYRKPQFIYLKPPVVELKYKQPTFNHNNPADNPLKDKYVFDTASYLDSFKLVYINYESITSNPEKKSSTTLPPPKKPLLPPKTPPKQPITEDNTDTNQILLTAPVQLELDKYLALRKQKIQQYIYDSLTKTYDTKKAMSRSDLAFLLGQSTGLAIPLPPNPILNIFGKPELAINVNGTVNVTIGWRWDFQNLSTSATGGQLQSSPIFRQDVRVNLNARIGDKLKFNIDHNTRSMFDFDKKFKIGYEGYEDDIIKKVEIGNITFETGSSLINSASELFGVGAKFQFGPLLLSTAISQKKGRKNYVDVRGGASKQTFQIKVWNYAQNHFFLDTLYKQVYNEYYKHSTPIIPKNAANLRIKQIQVWEASNDLRNPHISYGVAVSDLKPIKRKLGENYTDEKHLPLKTGYVEKGRFALLDINQYFINYNLGTLTLRNFRQDRYYAVSYRLEGETNDTLDDETVGEFSNQVALNDTILLRLIYRPNLLPNYKDLWARQMKNRYNIGASNINLSDTKIAVWYNRKTNDSTEQLDGADRKIVTMLGVDRVTNSTGSEPPDGIFDINNAAFINTELGYISFPHSEPFANGLVDYFESIGNKDLANQYVFRQIYDTTMEIARKNTAKDRFIIVGEMSGRQTNRISLGTFNLTPGSVRVRLDGRELREYDDYTIEYTMGMLTIRDPRAMYPNANLQIEYEQKDVFTTSTKTFMGVRADYELFHNRLMTATLGATAVRYSQAIISDRAVLGDEPIANNMFGIDFKFNSDAPYITGLLDLLPFYDTKAPSTITFNAEWAMVNPTPNRIRSEIPSDNNSPVAEVDNFEAVTRSTSLGTSFLNWQHSSAPVDSSVNLNNEELSEVELAAKKQMYRGRMFWWQYSIPRVRTIDVYPKNRSYQSGANNTINALYINFDPTHRGIYNPNTEYLDDNNPNFDPNNQFYYNPENKEKVWAGMQRMLNSSSFNFDADNVEFLDVMINFQYGTDWQNAKVFFDLGMISEDVIPDGIGGTEDGITDVNPLPNGIIDEGEDVGIDAIDDNREKDIYLYPLNLEDDPARDNFTFDFSKDDRERGPVNYIRYNNFEKNSGSDMYAFPDKEMLNSNTQTLSTDNSYYSYQLILNTDPASNPQIVGGNPEAGWHQFRIPIRKPTSKVGDPQFSNMQYIRFRVEGGAFDAIIADWKLLGNYWRRDENFETTYNPNDSVMQVSYVNVWENSSSPDYYEMPPGVQAPRQIGSLDYSYDSRANEQSLSISVKNLLWGEERMAVKVFYDMDFFNYKRLKYFIHGDGSMPMALTSISGKPRAYSFIRFGLDSGNYYEYRQPLLNGWQEVEINLSDLTSIKQIRDTMMLNDRAVFPVPGNPTAHYAIKGNPILTKIRFVGIGIANESDNFQELTTTMWIDELRLLDPEASNDWAGVASFSSTLADLGTINIAYNNYEPNFHRIEERYGNRNRSSDWNVNIGGNLEKFAPKSFNQMRIPINYSHQEKLEKPRYVANNDIELESAANNIYQQILARGGSELEATAAANRLKMESSSLSVQDAWSLSGIKLGIPVKHWLVNETVNRITASYSYSQIFERSSIYAERFDWVWRLGLNYALPISDLLVIKPFTKFNNSWFFIGAWKDLKLNFLPSNVTLNLDMQRRRQTELLRQEGVISPIVREFMAKRNVSLNWKLSSGGLLSPTIDYNFTTGSTLVPFEVDELGRQRSGSELSKEIFFRNSRLIDFGFNTDHQQNLSINFKPVLPNILGFHKYLDITGSYSSNYRWRDPLQSDETLRDASKSANVSSAGKIGVVLKLKELGNNLFGIKKAATTGKPKAPQKDTVSSNGSGIGILTGVLDVFRTIFFDWDKINFNFNNASTSSNMGVFGGSGLDNFWGRGLTFRESEYNRGPSFAYQLGLVSSPHGSWQMNGFSFETTPGLRPPNGVFQDNFNQTNNLDIKTTRQLWPGATIDLLWKMALQLNKNMTIDTDSNGVVSYSNVIMQDNLNRTFLSVPNFFGLNLFGNPVEKIVGIFNEKRAALQGLGLDSLSLNERTHLALSEAFYEGLEAGSITSGRFAKNLPAINWTFRWDGLEKFPLWNGIVKRMNIEHNYTSTYVEIGHTTDLGRTIQTQTMQSGFSPLFGVTASFDEKVMKGVLTASIKWSETSNYSATTASGAIISLQRTTDITANASYVMKQFSIPFLGFNLKNDFEIAFLFTFKKNNTGTFDVLDEKSYSGNNATGGRTLNGNTQIILEPSARYVISQMITARFFFRYEGTFNEGAANPGFHNTQVGLDINLNISGGR
jgi:cell surface protein SprA